MKKYLCLTLSLLLIVSIFAGCAPQNSESALEDNGKLVVYTSFYPMYDFAKKIGGDKISVHNLVPAGTEPHDWEPATTDITNLERADMFIYSGLNMEHWVDKVLSTLENKDLIVVEASKDIETIKENDSTDPHIWLSIAKAKQQMENIKDALVAADSENADYYAQNYKKYAQEFDILNEKFKTEISVVPKKTIVVAHEAFAYLCAEYGLTQMGIEGLNPESEPDPERMTEIINFAKENDVTTIFFEELVSPKVAEIIAKEIGAKTAVLNPVEGLTDEQIESGEDYLSIMQQNLEALVTALS